LAGHFSFCLVHLIGDVVLGYIFLGILVTAALGYVIARGQANRLTTASGGRLHSLPSFHGAYAAIWTGLPALILVLIWLLFQGSVIDSLLIQSLPDEKTEGLSEAEISLLLGEIKNVARGQIFSEPGPEIVAAAERYQSWRSIARMAMIASAAALMLLGFSYARARMAPEFRARQGVESALNGLMVFCSIVAIFTTLGIILSLLLEALQFFQRVSPWEFFFGLSWEPQIPLREDQVAAEGAFGAVPVFAGTLIIATIAMAVAAPIGLLSAIYLTEYSGPTFRSAIKPLLEILAGIPTVVYGFFAVLVVSPAMRDFGMMIGLDVAPNSALAAGAVMGIMIIPFVSSLSDDALNAVPQTMRDGAYALGATKAETVTRVLLPAALPGIMGGILLAVSRAIGETMIVVMAAGLIATLTANPLEGVTTVTVQIVTLLIGDTEFDSPKTLAAFALGLVLFVVTLILNVIAVRIVQKYREQYE